MTDRVTPCLWFNDNAEEAVDFYVSVVPDSRIVSVSRYGEAMPGKAGEVLMIAFELAGRRYWALNGGMDFPFSEAVSLAVACDTQAEIDRLWDRLGEGGSPQACGWIKDRFGMPWQVVPAATERWLSGDQAAADRVMKAVLGMVKLDIATLERAYAGEAVTA
jgi:predicted 3-demethylubiquinone-9 3-methyltransferase (glyoxalase superfamily)